MGGRDEEVAKDTFAPLSDDNVLMPPKLLSLFSSGPPPSSAAILHSKFFEIFKEPNIFNLLPKTSWSLCPKGRRAREDGVEVLIRTHSEPSEGGSSGPEVYGLSSQLHYLTNLFTTDTLCPLGPTSNRGMR